MEFLRRRAAEFHDNSKTLLEDGYYALSAFNAEQAVQLELKYFIGSRLGDFPRTHSLVQLFRESIKLCPELETTFENHSTLISLIEDAHIMTRYFDKEYQKEDVSEMVDFYTELEQDVEKCAK
jgi:HEPN domain-containing protein